MTDNLEISADAAANHTLHALRQGGAEGKIDFRTEIRPGLLLVADPAFSQVTGKYRSPKGRILELDVKTEGAGAWIGLHLALPVSNLADKGVVGFASRIAAPELMIMRACLRSGTGTGFSDAFFDKHILAQPNEATHLDALPIHRQTGLLPMFAPWRELIFFLPTHSFQLSLIDLRVFVV